MQDKANSKEYWDKRFRSLDWRKKGGNFQTINHAKRYVPLLGIPKGFNGSICDFGCAEGDAFKVYRKYFPKAKFIGVDFSENAISIARERYGRNVNFIVGDEKCVPSSDIIITSHVIEHLENDKDVVSQLRFKCKRLFIIVPVEEENSCEEHRRIYSLSSYDELKPKRVIICKAGWSLSLSQLIYQIYIKNIARYLILGRIIKEPKQIIFEFEGQNKRHQTL